MIIRPDSNVFTPSCLPGVAPLNTHQIVILGGRDEVGFLGDVIVYDTLTNQVEQVCDNEEYLAF